MRPVWTGWCAAQATSPRPARPVAPDVEPRLQNASLLRSARSVLAFVFEGEFQLGAVGRDLAALHDDILLDDFGDPQVAQRLTGPLDRRLRRLLPGVTAGADQLDHFVDALGHGNLPDTTHRPGLAIVRGRRSARCPMGPFLVVRLAYHAVANLPNSQSRPGAAANRDLV